jgi:hypothetical protein
MYRRLFVASAAAAVILRAQPTGPRTVVYKIADGREIRADVFGLPEAGRKPVAVATRYRIFSMMDLSSGVRSDALTT